MHARGGRREPGRSFDEEVDETPQEPYDLFRLTPGRGPQIDAIEVERTECGEGISLGSGHPDPARAVDGLELEDMEIVFNYDLSHDGEDYGHRIGGTGRAGKGGKAVTFVAGREIYRLENIQRFIKSRIRRERIPSAEEVEGRRATVFAEALRERGIEDMKLRPPGGKPERGWKGIRLRSEDDRDEDAAEDVATGTRVDADSAGGSHAHTRREGAQGSVPTPDHVATDGAAGSNDEGFVF